MCTEVLERRFAAIGARLNVGGPRVGAPRIDVGTDRRASTSTSASPAAAARSTLEVVDVEPRRSAPAPARARRRREEQVPVRSRRAALVRRRGPRGRARRDRRGGGEGRAAAGAVRDGGRPRHGRSIRSAVGTRPTSVRASGSSSRRPSSIRRPELVLRNEPLSRGRGKAHVLELAYPPRRRDVVWVKPPSSERNQRRAQFDGSTDRSSGVSGGWTRFVRDPELFAKGAVRHPDHATIVLRGWHRVVMNTEQGARAMRHVAFLD